MGRRRPANVPKKTKASMVWLVAVYIRLSREDGNEESESVINQKKILTAYLEKQFVGQHVVVDFYIDDGLSGTDDARESFRRMIHDIEDGKVNCVVCKTLARAFRNYADQGFYLESYFPQKNVRFISTGDPKIDTYTNPEAITGLEVPISGLMNDRFAAKTSSDVRRTFDHKRSAGEYIGAFAPYGYLKDPKDKNKLIIDEVIVPIKKDMLRWIVQEGMSLIGVAKRLNELGIPNPTAYKHSLGWNYQNPHAQNNDGMWVGSTVRRTLLDKVNLGHMVQGKQRVVSYKVHDKVAVSEDEWYVVENTHEPTFTQEEYDALAGVLRRDTRTPNGKRTVHLFSGFLRCFDCKKALQRAHSGERTYYCCRTYREKSKVHCTKHSIRLDVLECAVLTMLQAQVALLESISNIADDIKCIPAAQLHSKRLEKSLREKQRALEKAQTLAGGLYVDWKGGEVSHDQYRFLKAKFEHDAEQAQAAIAGLEEEQRRVQQELNSERRAFVTCLEHKNVPQLDRALLVALVDMIEVHEDKTITVMLAYQDLYTIAADETPANQPPLPEKSPQYPGGCAAPCRTLGGHGAACCSHKIPGR